MVMNAKVDGNDWMDNYFALDVLKSVLGSLPGSFLILDETLICIYTSPGNLEPLTGTDFTLHLPAGDRKKTRAFLQQAFTTTEESEFIARTSIFDEKESTTAFKVRAFNSSSSERYLVLSIIDRSIQSLLENSIEDAEEQFRALFETSTDGIILAKPDRTIFNANSKAQNLLSCLGENLVGSSLETLFDNPRERDKFISVCESMQDGCEVKEFLFSRTDSRNKKRQFISQFWMIKDENDKPFQITFIFSDISRENRQKAVHNFLVKLSEASAKSKNLIELIRQIRRQLSNLMDTKNFYVTLYNPVKNTYTLPYHIDENDSYDSSQEYDLVGTVTDYVRRTGKPLLLDQNLALEMERENQIRFVGSLPAQWLGAPLRNGNTVIGVVTVQSYTDPKLYSRDDVDLLSSVADHIAMAVERKQAEEKIVLSEYKFRSIVESSPMGMHFYRLEENGDLIFTGANSAANEILGVNCDSFVGLPIEKAFPPLADTEIPDQYRKVAESGSPWTTQQVDYKDQSIQGAFEVFAFQTTPRSIAVLFLDITTRLQTENALRSSEEKYSSILNAMDDPLYIANDDYVITYMNTAMKNRVGKDAVGEICHEIIHGSSEKCKECKAEKIFAGEHTVYELHSPKDNRTFLVSGIPIRKDDGKIEKLSIYRDISDLLIAEKEQHRLTEELHQSQKMELIGQLAGGIAHDFNNMLTAISGSADLALTTLSKHDPLYEDLEEIATTTERAGDLTRQLLTFSRKGHISPKVLNLNSTIQGMNRLLKRTLGEHIDLSTDLDDTTYPVYADPAQVEQIILNLAVNARDAMPNGGRLRISTFNVKLSKESIKVHEEADPGDYVCTIVTDEGTGIPDSIIKRIFEPFFTTKKQGKGTGLGLATVYGVVKQNRGIIRVDSVNGKGTSFHIYLPRHYGEAEKSNVQSKKTVQGGDELIMVVEDNPVVLKSTVKALKHFGYNVITANSGAVALDLLKDSDVKPDLIVSDVVMPILSGKDFMDRAREMGITIPFLFTSGYTDDNSLLQAIINTEIPFLPKPFKPLVLAEKIRKLLDHK